MFDGLRNGGLGAAHFQRHVVAGGDTQLMADIAQVFLGDVDRADIGHLAGQGQAVGIDVGQGDAARPGEFGDGGGHDADGPSAGDQDVLAQHIGLLHGMDGIAERIEHGAQFTRHALGQGHDVEGGNGQVLGETARAVDADALCVRIEVEAAHAGGFGIDVDDMAFAGDALAEAELARDAAADLHDLAGEFVAGDHRDGNGLLRPLVPVIDMDVGAADGGMGDADQHVFRAAFGHRRGHFPDTGLGLQLAEAFHRRGEGGGICCKGLHVVAHATTPNSLPTLVKAAIALSICSKLCAADIWVRMRAWPSGTTGKEKPMT